MNRQDFMIQRHAEIVLIARRSVELIKGLVQSTEQSFHYAWLFVAALIIA
jgi:hypothetical protein